MKKGVWIIGFALVLLSGYLAAGPFLAVSEIKTGIVERDSVKLSQNIEFPVLRQNLKERLNTAVMRKASAEAKDNPWALLATGFATKMVDGVVDSFVTPSGLAVLMEGKKPSRNRNARGDEPVEKDELLKNARYSYDSMSMFSVWVPNDEGQETRFVFQRYGLSWKLVNLIVPIDEKL